MQIIKNILERLDITVDISLQVHGLQLLYDTACDWTGEMALIVLF